MSPATGHAHMGLLRHATQVSTPGMGPRRARTVILVVAGCTALQMTSYGMIFPLFARKVEDLGGDVAVLATSVMAYALAGAVAAPLAGALADRVGRRPMIIASFAVFAAAFTGYALVATSLGFIVVRGLAGALTAGLGPATIGLVADIAPADERARWIGVVSGGTSAGFILGPIVGGLLYDEWGYGPPFLASIGIALLTLAIGALTIPETYTEQMRRRAALRRRRADRVTRTGSSFTSSLPRPLPAFATLLFVTLSMVSAWFLVDPMLPFFAFDDLGWSTTQFGAVISLYGWATMIGSLSLGRSSDRFGRRPVLVVGLVLHAALYGGLLLSDAYGVIIATFVVAGVGEALVNPALTAAYLDITPAAHRSRAMGIKAAVASVGSLVAPALTIVVVRSAEPQRVFAISAALILGTALLVLVGLRMPRRADSAGDPVWEASEERVMAARSALVDLTASAATARRLRDGA